MPYIYTYKIPQHVALARHNYEIRITYMNTLHAIIILDVVGLFVRKTRYFPPLVLLVPIHNYTLNTRLTTCRNCTE